MRETLLTTLRETDTFYRLPQERRKGWETMQHSEGGSKEIEGDTFR